MLSKECVMSVGEDVPWVRCGNFGEEVIGISDKDGRSVLRELGVEEDLWGL
jgi:hypothetical protein